jgi:hypothetical protein
MPNAMTAAGTSKQRSRVHSASATDPAHLRRLSGELLEKAKIEPDENLKGHLIRAALSLAQLAEKLARHGSS